MVFKLWGFDCSNWILLLLILIFTFIVLYRIFHGPIESEPIFSASEIKEFLKRLERRGSGKKKIRGKFEGECRRIFEKHFRKPFPNTRPDFLKNPYTNHNLELDGYNPDLKIAFEYNGAQHVKPNSLFKMDQNDVRYQQFKDSLKNKLCQQHGIKLYVIPHTVPFKKLETFILDLLRKNPP